LLFTANQWISKSKTKDYRTMREAAGRASQRLCGQPTIFLALGEEGPVERIGQAEIRFVPFQKDARVVASYYQAANLYLHAAHVDTFPTTILEALACGTPVVATAVCGIPEQVRGLRPPSGDVAGWNRFGVEEATGILVAPGDVEGMAAAIVRLRSDP